MSCDMCRQLRALACASCERWGCEAPGPIAQHYWCCPCGENPEWAHETCPVCGRKRPDLLQRDLDEARAWQRKHS